MRKLLAPPTALSALLAPPPRAGGGCEHGLGDSSGDGRRLHDADRGRDRRRGQRYALPAGGRLDSAAHLGGGPPLSTDRLAQPPPRSAPRPVRNQGTDQDEVPRPWPRLTRPRPLVYRARAADRRDAQRKVRVADGAR